MRIYLGKITAEPARGARIFYPAFVEKIAINVGKKQVFVEEGDAQSDGHYSSNSLRAAV